MLQTVAEPSTSKQPVTVHIVRGRASRGSRAMTGDELLIGAGPDCDVQMRSTEIADRHCQIARRGRQITLRRLHQEFPVYLNGKSVANSKLENGDRLKIGPFEVQVEIGADSAEFAAVDADVEPTGGDAVPGRAGLLETPRAIAPIDAGKSSVERRLRVVAEQLERIESQRSELDQLRGKIEQRQAALEREHRDQAGRNEELTRLEQDLAKRQQQVVDLERNIERQRLELTESSQTADADRRDLSTAKEKFFRVRRKALDLFGHRNSALLEAQRAVEAQSAQLQESLERFEQERSSWRKLGEQNESTQRELQERMAELAARFDRLDMERTQLDRDRQQLDVDVRNLRQKEAAVRLSETELSQKQSALSTRESELSTAQSRFQDDVARLQASTLELERRANELESEARRAAATRQDIERRVREAEAVEEQLDASRKELDAQRDDFERMSQARTIEVELLNQSIQTEQGLLQRRTKELEERELHLEADAEQQRLERERLAALADAIARDTMAVEQRSRELEEHAQRIVATCDSERQTLAGWRGELENEVRLCAQERESFESYRKRWVAKSCRVREAACDMAQRRAILAARERQLLADHKKQEQRGTLLKQKESELLSQCSQLQSERIDLHQRQEELTRKAAVMATEAARLESLGQELESRHAVLFERERTWRDEVLRKRREIEEAANRLEKRQQLLDRQAVLHGRHLDKIRQVGLETVDKRNRAKVDIESAIARHEQFQRQLEAIRARQQAVLAEVLAQMELASKRESEANEWLARIQRENDGLVELQAGFARAIEQMLQRMPADSNLPANAAVSVALSAGEVESWRGAIAACLDRLEKFAGTLAEREHHLQTLRTEDAAARAQLQELLATVAAAEVLGEQLSKPSQVDDAEPESPLIFAAASPPSTPTTPLPEGFRAAGIQALLHRGTLATTYQAVVPGVSSPVALRLYAPQWCRDPKLRAVFESNVRSLAQFDHPNVAKTISFFADAGVYGAVAEWIDGTSFTDLKASALTVDLVRRWMEQGLEALGAAHAAGFVHRCLTPSKLLLDRQGNLRLIGFGEPTWFVNLRRCEQPKSLRAFVAPETAGSGIGDARADLYSIGRLFLPIVDALQLKLAAAGAVALPLGALRACAEKLAAPLPGDRFQLAADALTEIRSIGPAPANATRDNRRERAAA